MNFAVALSARECQFSAMGGKVVVAALALLAAGVEAQAAAPILSLIHKSQPTRRSYNSYAVICF
jgi:hypothetical protein